MFFCSDGVNDEDDGGGSNIHIALVISVSSNSSDGRGDGAADDGNSEDDASITVIIFNEVGCHGTSNNFHDVSVADDGRSSPRINPISHRMNASFSAASIIR